MIGKHLYNIIFWISRILSISIFGICLSIILHAKYVFFEQYSNFLNFIIENLENITRWFVNFVFSIGIDIAILPDSFNFFSNFCKNSQSIDLLIIALIFVIVISIVSFKFFNKKYWLVYIIILLTYIGIYVVSGVPIMLVLAIITPMILIIIIILNKICPVQKIIMLIPIIGEICCIENIVKYIYRDYSENIKKIGLIIIVLLVSNIICFLIPYTIYTSDTNIKNLLIRNNSVYSIKCYDDGMIATGDKKLIFIDKKGKYNQIRDNKFCYLEDFIVNKNEEEVYIYNREKLILLVLDIKSLNIKNKIFINNAKLKSHKYPARIMLNDDSSKLIIVFEYSNIGCLIDLKSSTITYIKMFFLSKKWPISKDWILYNKFRKCFLVSFYERVPFLQEIDTQKKKIRKIKADKCQGYIAMSKKNKEIYVAFHQQGKIGVYDAETMKLKRKIKSNYTVKDITYDEELNILIAPSYFTGYVDIFSMDGSDKLLTREFVGYELREGCFDSQKENLYVCSPTGLYKKKIDIKKLIEEKSNVSYETKN